VQDLILNAKSVVDGLPWNSLPGMLIITDAVVGMPSELSLRDTGAMLRSADMSVGFILLQVVTRARPLSTTLQRTLSPQDGYSRIDVDCTCDSFCMMHIRSNAHDVRV